MSPLPIPTPLPAPVEWLLKRAPILDLPVRFGFRFFERWDKHACPLMAAALAFFGLLSLFPLTLAGVAILAGVLSGDALALKNFAAFVSGFFPGAAGAGVESAIQNAVLNIANGPSAATASLLALASLLWSGRAYFDTLATVLNRILPGAMPRTFLAHQLTLWGLMLGSGALFLLSSAATFALSLAQTLALRAPDLFLNRAPIFWDLAGKSVSYGLTYLMFFLLYRFAPGHNLPRRRIVLVSALIATLGWELAKWGFGRFLGNVARYEATYGSIAGVVVTMLWIYFSSVIVLAGAQFGATWEEFRLAKHQIEAKTESA